VDLGDDSGRDRQPGGRARHGAEPAGAGVALESADRATIINALTVLTLSGRGRWQKGTIGNLLAQTKDLVMGPIPPSLHPPIFIVLVAMGAIFIQRKFGWKGCLIVWLASTVLSTGFYVTRYYLISPLSIRETLINARTLALALFPLFLLISGMLVWIIALIVPPPTEPEYFPPMVPLGRLEDMHELPSVPWRYQELLAAYGEARKKAVVRPGFRVYFPSYIRQSFVSTRQLWRVPHVIMRGFVAAEPVLAELGEMTTAQLSALEAYHRINLRHVKRRLIPLRLIVWFLPTAGLAFFKVLSSLITAMEERGMIANLQWNAVLASI
jgi:hypothetical protein